MNRLPLEKRVLILGLLTEGTSLRAASRLSGASINTVTKLLVDVGTACQRYHDEHVRGLTSRRVQCDEIWSFVYSKQKNVPENKRGSAGDVWTWTAVDADSKLAISWLVGGRDADYANAFMLDVADRLKNRVQLTTDGHHPYLEAIEGAFGADVDYATLIKVYGAPLGGTRRYSQPECIGTRKGRVEGRPDPKHVSTSFVERQNLTMRMHMRRFTRLTNAFSKKVENHAHAVALHFMFYNFCRIHKTLRVSPAKEAGVSDHLWELEELAGLG
ncbi:MAG: IS1 family transposase [Alphaproteobacteria bacterium]|nr:IS1 family transposase [Alphaproteobacteria bacterium]MBT5860150.1 IS1 family transposase [Alphaproteobacteria bacterium]